MRSSAKGTDEAPSKLPQIYISRFRRDLTEIQPKPFLNIVDEHILKPWQYATDEFTKNFPTVAFEEMLFNHQYLNFTPVWNLDYENIDKIILLPDDALAEVYLFGEKLYNEFPEFIELSQNTTEMLQTDLLHYSASLSPWLEFLKPEPEPSVLGGEAINGVDPRVPNSEHYAKSGQVIEGDDVQVPSSSQVELDQVVEEVDEEMPNSL